MRRAKGQQHNIEGAFVLVLFAVFAITVIAVLALGANSYRRLVERDNDAYNKRIITSYVAAKIRSADAVGSVAVGGFSDPKVDDGVNTLHLYREIEGDIYDQRIYYYEGQVYEILTIANNNIEPEAGSPILDANGLEFEMSDGLVTIKATDTDDRVNHTSVAVRSIAGVSGRAGTDINESGGDSGGVG
ncbi:MAG: DUF4860 domain-containing protein [Eubacterium sp.]|nr:DUF4860 domain-containing protein [Eubacterium sp.]